jgi:hypothetical protein
MRKLSMTEIDTVAGGDSTTLPSGGVEAPRAQLEDLRPFPRSRQKAAGVLAILTLVGFGREGGVAGSRG